MRASFEPATRWSTRTPSRRPGPGRKSSTIATRSSMPPRCSTTTPSTRQVVAPHLFDEFGVMSTLDVDAARQRNLGRRLVRPPTRRRCAPGSSASIRSRRGEDHRFAVDQVAGPDRERFGTAVPVFELHPAVLDADHRPDETRLRVLDDHADLHGLFGRPGLPRSMRVVGEHVGAIAISHRVIVG